MTDLTGKRVFIIQQRLWGIQIGHRVARILKENGAVLGGMCIRASTYEFCKKQSEVPYETLINVKDISANPEAYLGDDDFSLEEICRELGITGIWPLVQAVRSFVKCYKDKFMYGFKQNVGDEKIVLIIKAWYKLVRRVFDEFSPDVILTPNFVSLIHIMLNLYADKHGVPILAITDSKIPGHDMIVYDYLDSRGPVFDRFFELQAGAKSERLEEAKSAIGQLRQKLRQPSPPKTHNGPPLVKETLILGLKIAQSCARMVRQKGRLKQLVQTDAASPRLLIRDFLAAKTNRWNAGRIEYDDIGSVGRFAYFPLQVQPEMQVDVFAPQFNNLIEMARLSAMALPGDMTLVVKDHPVMAVEGLRCRSYLEKVARTPNVKLVHYNTPTATILERAEMVISPNSTTLVEAAFFNTPCIQFGELGSTQLFPNIFKHTDFTTLGEKISEVLAMDFSSPEYDAQIENYVCAVLEKGTSLPHAHIWYHGTEEELEAMSMFFSEAVCDALSKKAAHPDGA